MEDIIKRRTSAQHRALMVYEKELAQALLNMGMDMRTFIKIDIMPTKAIVHDNITLPLVKSMFNKNSTKELEVHEVNELFEVINKNIGERCGIHIPFPSKDNAITNEEYAEMTTPTNDPLHPWRNKEDPKE